MSGDYDRIRTLLLEDEQQRLANIDSALQRNDERFEELPDTLAKSIERANLTRGTSRLARALSESTAESLELAVRKRPSAIVQAVFPVIGPAIRRALGEALRGMAQDLDQVLAEALSFRALRWRIESWRTGTAYAQVALRHRLQYLVEHLFVIRSESGLLLDHLSAPELPDVDADAIAGMLTAIEQFVQDSMSTELGSGLGAATVGHYRLLISHGPWIRVAAFVRGVPPSGLGQRLDELNEALHACHGQALLDLPSRGTSHREYLQSEALADLNQLRPSDSERGNARRYGLVFGLGGVLLILLMIWWVRGYVWGSEVQQIREELADVSGFVLLEARSYGWGKLHIIGLHDPAAPDPRHDVARNHPEVVLDWEMRSYISSEPEVVVRRAQRLLSLPDGVASRLDLNDVLHLTGMAPFSIWYEVRYRSPNIPGVRGIDSVALSYPGKDRVDTLIARIESSRIDFSERTSPSNIVGLEGLVAAVDELEQQTHRSGIVLHLRAFGFTDEPGSLEVNRQLRMRRAEWLAESLHKRLHAPIDIDVSLDTLSAKFHGKHRAANLQVLVTPR